MVVNNYHSYRGEGLRVRMIRCIKPEPDAPEDPGELESGAQRAIPPNLFRHILVTAAA